MMHGKPHQIKITKVILNLTRLFTTNYSYLQEKMTRKENPSFQVCMGDYLNFRGGGGGGNYGLVNTRFSVQYDVTSLPLNL